jgi:putative two-component system response regulator
MVVDDDAQNRKLLRVYLASRGYTVKEADIGEKALATLQTDEVDLVLLDVMIPGMDGYEVCRRIKSRDSALHLPVILVTALDDTEAKTTGTAAGADDFLTKPYRFVELETRVGTLIRLKRSRDGMVAMRDALASVATAVEARDPTTRGHTERVVRLAVRLGEKLARPAGEIECLRIGAPRHDIGKIGVPEAILNKPGPLSDEEWKVMRTHPEVGFRLCAPLGKTQDPALRVIRHHHERLDGSSYPDRLKGEQIPIAARIMAVVDAYDAMTSDRPHRGALPQESAFSALRQEVAEGKLDGDVVEALIAEVQGG